MSDQGDLTPGQIDVIRKLLPQVQRLTESGMTQTQIVNSLVLVDGWPIGAVQAAIERCNRS